MVLARVDVPPSAAVLPRDVAGLLEESARRLEEFLRGRTLPGFIPSDFEQVYRTLRTIACGNVAPGDCFCEWGSGLGVVSLLAAQLRLDAHGIEIEAELVEAARGLADDFELPVDFACGTFVPPGGEAYVDTVAEFDWLCAGGGCGYEELGLAPDDLDIVFAYPWPGEESVVDRLFDRFAADGAVLVTYRGLEGVHVQRKGG